MKLKNIINRTWVGILLIALIITFSIIGEWPLFALVSLISVLLIWELFKIIEHKGITPHYVFGYIAVVSYCLLFYLNLTAYFWPLTVFHISFITIIELFRNRRNPILNISTSVFGILYIALFGHIILLRQLPLLVHQPYSKGGYWVGYFFSLIWLYDTTAYLIGSFLGRTPMFPRISPKKTWEGAMGGTLFTLLGSMAYYHLFHPQFSFIYALGFALVVAVIGPIGDLIESMLKRDAAVKDASQLLPGHGGILDRFDSVLLSAPIFYYLLLSFLSKM